MNEKEYIDENFIMIIHSLAKEEANYIYKEIEDKVNVKNVMKRKPAVTYLVIVVNVL